MPDWKGIVRHRLAALKLEGSKESEVFDELAQHLEDRYEELLQSGISAARRGAHRHRAIEHQPLAGGSLSRARHRRRPNRPRGRAISRTCSTTCGSRFRGMRQKPTFSLLVVGMLALGNRRKRRHFQHLQQPVS
jgi:putative ABC transport system permease protein